MASMASITYPPRSSSELTGGKKEITALQLVLVVSGCSCLCVLPVSLAKGLGLNLSNLLSDQSEGVPTDFGEIFGFPCSAGFPMLSTLFGFAMPCRPKLGTHFSVLPSAVFPASLRQTRLPDTVIVQRAAANETKRNLEISCMRWRCVRA
ncbi:hypothetical protein B0T20DRAFT_419054 [Sordaria brevicollis]|uniref:Uncharacterized protein n=1 Tax=Sordaria brevicollis TaxID=83679 RepID=A0AAE0P918_SORBR|nr:hypothetical protein B0T20DRAFT_419054 [Sordaria brevicollis]